MKTSHIGFFAGMLLAAVALLPSAHAQLVSPGKLIAAHAEWDRIDTCISCHALGERGVDTDRCLSCHTPLAVRIEQDLGLHATFDEPNCASCHKDHFGRDFDPIRFDTLAFDHDLTGYDLLLSHAETSCSSCHQPDYVNDAGVLGFRSDHNVAVGGYLGLDETCLTCHSDDNPHESQFDEVSCASCHDQGEWEDAVEFDHAASRFLLTGEHLDVACESCHEPATTNPDLIVYRPLDFGECSSCHEDEHDGRLGVACASCHITTGWSNMASSSFEDSFDHASTGFDLIGQHAAATCASCHDTSYRSDGLSLRFLTSGAGRQYPHPESTSCASCHVDAHDGALETTEDCASCHAETGWSPSAFDTDRHQEETDFVLEGAHLAVFCSQCHESIQEMPSTAQAWKEIDLSVADPTCEGCHTDDDPHGEQFSADACESCHTVTEWLSPRSDFDHDETDFLLRGAHEVVACASCHEPNESDIVQFRDTDLMCASCHNDDSPHDDQFAPDGCESCHDDQSFRMVSFDHKQTGWSLLGAHTDVACLSCHITRTSTLGEEVIQFRGIGTECKDCHGGGQPDE